MTDAPPRGTFIVLDGPEGSGKSTQVARLAERLRARGRDVTCVRDPGGTAAGERIRALLLDPELGDVDAVTEMLLYMASRRELVRQHIAPAVRRGEVVLSDRFISSTVVYQGYAGGLDPEVVLAVGRIACGETQPDLVVLVDFPSDAGLRRAGPAPDRMELKGSDFHARVAEGFRSLARAHPERHVLIDGRGSLDEVAARVWEAVQRVLR